MKPADKRDDLNQRLSQISTMWTRAAQQLLLKRYGGAVHRYLLRAVATSMRLMTCCRNSLFPLKKVHFATPIRTEAIRFCVKQVLSTW